MAFDYKKEYKEAIGLLYAIAFTIKMSYKGSHKENFEWIAMIRLPEFVTREEFDWAITEAADKRAGNIGYALYYLLYHSLFFFAYR